MHHFETETYGHISVKEWNMEQVLLWLFLIRSITDRQYCRIVVCQRLAPKTQSRYDDNVVATGDIEGCRNDNLRCHQ